MNNEERLREAGLVILDAIGWGSTLRISYSGPNGVIEELETALDELHGTLHPAEEQGLYACPTCGENVTRYGRRCPTCERALAEDRLERESGR